MKTFYIPVHFYEREDTDDELVMIITQDDVDDDDVQKRLEKIQSRHIALNEEDSSMEDMADAIIKELAEEINGVWCYCKPLPQLVIGDPADRAGMTGNLKAVSVYGLAPLLIRLNPGENLYFYERYSENKGISGHIYCATMIKKYESYVIYINCQGGGLPFIFDVTTYYQDLNNLKGELKSYFNSIQGIKKYVYVDSSLVGEEYADE